MIPIHATATANPRQLRWVVAADRLPGRGIVSAAPGRLGALLADGVIDEIEVRATDVLISLRADVGWRELGDEVRDALCAALLEPTGWQVHTALDTTGELHTIAVELLAGPIGALAQSHGGAIELVSVEGDTVTVRLSGACHGCPAATTVEDNLQRELRRQSGRRVTVKTESDSIATPLGPLGKKLFSLFVR